MRVRYPATNLRATRLSRLRPQRRRAEIEGVALRLEPLLLVGAVADRLRRGEAAAAERDPLPLRDPVLLPLGVDERERPLDPERPVVPHGDLHVGHGVVPPPPSSSAARPRAQRPASGLHFERTAASGSVIVRAAPIHGASMGD